MPKDVCGVQDEHSRWILLPTGQTCEWDLASGVIATTAPPYITLLVPILLVLWGVLIYLAIRSSVR